MKKNLNPFKGLLKLFKPDKSLEKEKFGFFAFLLLIIGVFITGFLFYWYLLKPKK